MSASPLVLVVVVVVAVLTRPSGALDNGAAPTPPMGWSSWNTFGVDISDEVVRGTARAMYDNGLFKAGYNYVLIDDGWSNCTIHKPDGQCLEVAPRDSQGRIEPDPNKFPYGMAALADYVHSLGMKIGIYTAVSSRTCAQYWGSLGYEAIDAATFAGWGMDFVKFDTCNYDCGVHDGCIPNSVAAMRDGLNATGRPVVLYLDDGNDSTGQRILNPHHYHVWPKYRIKVADVYSELVWAWPAADYANMWKSWFDIHDSWENFMDNLHMQISLSYYQHCGAYNFPDMLTIGQGSQTAGQYRAQMFIYAVLGSPLILGNDVRNVDEDTLTLLTAPEVLAVNQDTDCVQGSLLQSLGSTELWGKVLSDGTFAVALLNKGKYNETVNVYVTEETHSSFQPAMFPAAHVRDLWLQQDLGVVYGTFTVEVPAMDCLLYKFTPMYS
ncbi:glycoside hydrolase family 27 protein [Pelomyxa schiedti]|nr:glycoside hydrolase family 27 protein [Pelomyxa schiedti]